MADKEVDFTNSRNDLAATMTQGLTQSRENAMKLIGNTEKVIENANTGLARTLQDTNDLTDSASKELLEAIGRKRELTEVPRIVKNWMSLFGNENYNEKYQDLRIAETNAKLGIAEKRLTAGRQAHRIAVENAQTLTQNAITQHTLERQGLFDKFAISASINEEQKRQLAGMSDEALADMKKNKGKMPNWLQGKEGLIDVEMRTRQGAKAANWSQNLRNEFASLQLRDEKRNQMFADMDNEQLVGMANGKIALPKELSSREVTTELENRQSRTLSLDAAKRAKIAGDIDLTNLHVDQFTKNHSAAQLDIMIKEANKRGGAINLNGVEITADRLRLARAARLKQERSILNEQVEIIATNNANAANQNAAETRAAYLANLSSTKQLDPAVEAKVATIGAKITTAQAYGAPEVVSKHIQELQKLIDDEAEKAVTTKPTEAQAATREYLNTGRVRSPEAAFPLLGTSLMSDTLLADNHILGPLWKEASAELQAEKTRVSEGVPLFKGMTGRGEAGGIGNININQPKKANDDEAVKRAIERTGAGAAFGNTIHQKAIADSLLKLHEQMMAQGLSSPYGQFIMNINGRAELSTKLYSQELADPKRPNGPTISKFNPQRLWDELGAMTLRDTQAGSLPKGMSYGENLVNKMRDGMDDFEKVLNRTLHSSPEASAFTNLISGGNVRGFIADRLDADEKAALKTVELASDLQSHIDMYNTQFPATEAEYKELERQGKVPFGAVHPGTVTLQRRQKARDAQIQSPFKGSSDINSMLEILRQAGTVNPNDFSRSSDE